MALHDDEAGASTPSVALPNSDWPPTGSLFFQDKAVKRVWMVVTIGLLLILLPGIFVAIWVNTKLQPAREVLGRFGVLVIALVVVLLPTLYWWRTAMDFEVWLAKTQMSSNRKEFEKERFKTNQEYARAFWTALIVLFSTFLLGVRVNP